jgi:hypothetical protein
VAWTAVVLVAHSMDTAAAAAAAAVAVGCGQFLQTLKFETPHHPIHSPWSQVHSRIHTAKTFASPHPQPLGGTNRLVPLVCK